MRGFVLLLSLFWAAAAAAQSPAMGPIDSERAPSYASGIGGALLLTNHGFGIGGIYRQGIFGSTSLVVDVSIGAGKDEREQEFFAGPFGETVTPFKRHYFLMMPVTVGLEQRMWAASIEDNFRPFVQLTGGPVVGYQWPYFDDLNDNGIRDPGEAVRGPFDLSGGSFRLGVGGVVAFGAYFGEGAGNTLGLRIGYAAQYFPEPVDLMEPRSEIVGPSKQYFGTPSVAFLLLFR